MIAIYKQKMINELIQIINKWNEYSKEIYGYSKKDAETILKRLQTGVYNSVLRNTYWFTTPIQLDTLIKLEVAKKNIHSLTNISEENYIVYSAIYEIKEHLEYIYYWNKAYHIDYQTKTYCYKQPPASLKEQEQFEKLYTKVLTKNYTWHDAKQIIKELKELNIKENKDFPHNIKEIQKIFNTIYKPQYQNYTNKIKYSTNILNLNKTVNTLIQNITKNNIDDFLKDKKQNIYEEYIRQLIKNTKSTNIKEVKKLLASLITEKKEIDLSELDIPQPILTKIRKHYNFIFHKTTELEFLEESTEILEELKKIYSKEDNSTYNITLIYNTILISYGIIPIILTDKILKLTNEELIKKILEETIKQTNNFNKEK